MSDIHFCMANAFFHPFIGGVEKHMYELSRRLAKKIDMHVLTCQLENTIKEEDIDGVHVHRVKDNLYKMPIIYPPPMVWGSAGRTRLHELDKDFKFDVFNCHGRWYPDFTYSLKYARQNNRFGVLTVHNQRPLGIDPFISTVGTIFDVLVGRKVMNTAHKLIPVSYSAAEDIVAYGIKPEKMNVIHNGVDTTVFKPSPKTYRDKYLDGFDHLLITQCRLIKQKGVQYLISAMPEILKEFPKTRLLIVGKGNMKEKLMAQVKQMKLENNIVFPGFIPEEELPNMFSSPDVFVLPSLWEVLPISLLEALACGVPLVSSNAGGNAEIVKHGDNGFVFNMRDNPTMIKQITTLLGDEKLQSKMGKRSREIAEKEFEWDLIAKQTLDFYKKELNK